ncbi:MAG: hypothetical protein WCH60_15270 [Burkholderiales bacterium]
MKHLWIAAPCAAGVSHALDFSCEWIRPFGIEANANFVSSS